MNKEKLKWKERSVYKEAEIVVGFEDEEKGNNLIKSLKNQVIMKNLKEECQKLNISKR